MPVQREGWLLKTGERNTSKRKRWFVLGADEISWKERKESSSMKGRATLKKMVVRASETSKLGFMLETPERVYMLSAESANERYEWVRDISKNVTNIRTSLRQSKGSAGGILSLFPEDGIIWS